MQDRKSQIIRFFIQLGTFIKRGRYRDKKILTSYKMDAILAGMLAAGASAYLIGLLTRYYGNPKQALPAPLLNQQNPKPPPKWVIIITPPPACVISITPSQGPPLSDKTIALGAKY